MQAITSAAVRSERTTFLTLKPNMSKLSKEVKAVIGASTTAVIRDKKELLPPSEIPAE